MKLQLFFGAAVWHPNEKEEKEGMKSKVIIDLKVFLAKDEGIAKTMLAREIPTDYSDNLDQIDICVAGFR